MVQFGVLTQTQSVSLGTAQELVGVTGSISYTLENFNNEAVRLLVTLERADGTALKAVCSPRVSELVRSKQMTMSQLAGLPVKQQNSIAGEEIVVISMPDAARHEVKIKMQQLKVVEFKAPVAELTPEQLQNTIAL